LWISSYNNTKTITSDSYPIERKGTFTITKEIILKGAEAGDYKLIITDRYGKPLAEKPITLINKE
jgi:hypothetical protein